MAGGRRPRRPVRRGRLGLPRGPGRLGGRARVARDAGMIAFSNQLSRTMPDVRTTGAAGLATLLGACALRPVFSTGAWFPPVLAAVLVVAGSGLLLRTTGPLLAARLERRGPLPRGAAAAGTALVPLGQLFLLLCLLTTYYASGHALAGFLPTPGSLGRLGAVLAD